jgi:hypothetical protein
MRLKILVATGLAALAGAPGGSAAGPEPSRPAFPAPTVGPTVTVGPVQRLTVAAARQLGAPTIAAAGCGSCITTCWTTTVQYGASDWSGSYWLRHRPLWCGNGATLSYVGGGWDEYVSGWYSPGPLYGPWSVGGCPNGCGSYSQRASGKFTGHTPLIGFCQSITLSFQDTVYAWGGIGASP